MRVAVLVIVIVAGRGFMCGRAARLQKVRHVVRVLRPEHPLHGLGAQGQGQRLPPGLLRLLLLQEAAVHGRGVRAGGGEGAVQGSLRLHAGQPEARGGER